MPVLHLMTCQNFVIEVGFDTRLISDYQVDTHTEAIVVGDMIHQTREFLEAARNYLK
jgi:hypothetical protein